jgi:hypothetical protein
LACDQSFAFGLSFGGLFKASLVHLSLGEFGDLALFHRGRGAGLLRPLALQRPRFGELSLCSILFISCALHVKYRFAAAKAQTL